MREKKLLYKLMAGGAAIGMMTPALGVDFSFSGFIREEIAFKVSGQENQNNQGGNPYNNVPVPLFPNSIGPLLGLVPAPVLGLLPADLATGERKIKSDSNALNMLATRLELNFGAKFTDDLSATVRLRAFWDTGLYENYGDPNFFEVPFTGNRGTPLEVTGQNFMVDFPDAYIDYATGPLFIRVGNQQIAWGEAIFFRVLDVTNGLDLRRHLVLDPAGEEYSDKRVPGLGIRVSYQVTDAWELEAFVQKFNPSILPNPNTPYNIIPDQFTVHQREGYDAVDNMWNVGGRIRGQLGDFGLQFIAVNRRNPDGVFRWTKSGVNRDIPVIPGSGNSLKDTPFEVDPTGVHSSREWYDYAGDVRLDGTQGLNAAVDDFQPATGNLLAFNVGNNMMLAETELDLFFALSGGLRGHIERVYPQENVFGFGINYVFSGEPDTIFDQLITRFEMTYTPDKKFTNITLGQEFIEKDEYTMALIFEKYQRFFDDFPATYMVLQALHKSQSDIFGRALSGFGGSVNHTPDGIDSYTAVAFAAQQPFPNLIWRADLAVLYDIEGGVLIQPGLRWRPNDKIGVDLYGTFVVADDDNKNALSSIEYADEIFLRVSYQF